MKPLSLVMDLSASLYIGLVDADGRVLSSRVRAQGIRGEAAHDLLDECLREAGAGILDIARICAGIGPGSFTGIRVCLAMAQGLAFAGKLPLHPFSSLAAIAVCAPPTPPGGASPDGEARGGMVAAIAANAGRYFVSAPGIPQRSEALLDFAQLSALAGPGVFLMVSGNLPDRERLAPLFGAGLGHLEDTVDFARLVRLAAEATALPGGALRPNYLMASAAEEKRRSAGGDAPG